MMTARMHWYYNLALLIGIAGMAAERADAHCDSMDGPVIVDAKAAIESADVSTILKWVRPEDEKEIRAAFDKTLAVRVQGPEARELADLYFFETLVRIHRAGEGAPYTGLKPVGTDPGLAVRAADQALAQGDVETLAERIGEHAEQGVRERFARAIETKQHADHNTQAGRAYVAAYVEFVHYVKRLHESIAGHGGHRAEGGADEHAESKAGAGCRG